MRRAVLAVNTLAVIAIAGLFVASFFTGDAPWFIPACTVLGFHAWLRERAS